MKKLLIMSMILISTVIISCCSKRDCLSRYTLEIEKCNGKIDTITYVGCYEPDIFTHERAVPIMYYGDLTILNVCGYKVLNKVKVK